MAKWLTAGLSWGGTALAVLSVAALVTTPTPTAEAVALFWIMLFVGAVAAAVGFVVGLRKT